MEQSSQAQPGKVFHLFSRLPAEIRLKIWNHNLPDSRIVTIRCGAESLSMSPPLRYSYSSPRGCTSPTPIPANLHTCQESRDEALRRYSLCFGIARQPGRVFFDLERDVLYFGPRDGYMASEAQFRTVLTLASPAELALVRRIAINDALFWVDNNSHPYQTASAASMTIEVLMQIRTRLPGLRELVFVPRDENPIYSESATFVEPTLLVQSQMSKQISDAMDFMTAHFPDWDAPAWRIMALSSAPEPPACGQASVLGLGDDMDQLTFLRESIRQRFAQMS